MEQMKTYHLITKGQDINNWGSAYPIILNTFDNIPVVHYSPITLKPGTKAQEDCVLINHIDREAKGICADCILLDLK